MTPYVEQSLAALDAGDFEWYLTLTNIMSGWMLQRPMTDREQALSGKLPELREPPAPVRPRRGPGDIDFDATVAARRQLTLRDAIRWQVAVARGLDAARDAVTASDWSPAVADRLLALSLTGEAACFPAVRMRITRLARVLDKAGSPSDRVVFYADDGLTAMHLLGEAQVAVSRWAEQQPRLGDEHLGQLLAEAMADGGPLVSAPDPRSPFSRLRLRSQARRDERRHWSWEELQRVLDAAEPIPNRMPATARGYDEVVGRWYAEGQSPEEWAARNAHLIGVSSFPDYRFDDRALDAWAQRLAHILLTPGAVATCRRHLLSGPERRRVERDGRAF